MLPKWEEPKGRKTGIFVRNSFTLDDKELVLATQEKRLKMYCCGPTVYDVSHLGHARTYIGVDIFRRVLEDYFHIPITYCINVTDVDDKIIKKANKNLVEKMAAETLSKIKGDDKVKEIFKKALAENDASKVKKEQLKLLDFVKMRQYLIDYMEFAAKRDGNKDVNIEELEKTQPDTIAVSRKFEKSFWKDMEDLDLKPPTVKTRVTEYIPEIISFIEKIIKNGYAYESHGSIYFDTVAYQKKHVYGKLEPWSVGNLDVANEGEEEWIAQRKLEKEKELQELVTIFDKFEKEIKAVFEEMKIPQVRSGKTVVTSQIEKKNQNDFAVWKNSNPGEPAWKSPWGMGRPGWHIECSVMSSSILGDTFDIHTGGIDLAFPHHENEIAQSCGYTDKDEWVNYFLHCGHLSIENQKMSKSEKNFTTIQEALEIFNPKEIRMLFLNKKFFSGMDYSKETMDDAKKKFASFNAFFNTIASKIRARRDQPFKVEKWEEIEHQLFKDYKEVQFETDKALRNNIDTPKVIKIFGDLRNKVNKYLLERKDDFREPLIFQIANYMTNIFKTFGLIFPNNIGFQTSDADTSKLDDLIDTLSKFRDSIRAQAKKKENVLPVCDKLRDDILPHLGIKLEDQPNGVASWKRDDPKIILLQIERERELLEKKRKEKEERKRLAAEKKAKQLAQMKIDPKEMFKKLPELEGFEFDEAGIPIKDASGVEIPKKKKKKYMKQWKAQKKKHDKYLKSLQKK